MYEWRVFKQLWFERDEDFQSFVGGWKKNTKVTVEQRMDAYLILPLAFQELNLQWETFGLKFRNAKICQRGDVVKLKAKRIELKECSKRLDNGLELWSKVIAKKLSKKIKIPLQIIEQQLQQEEHKEQQQQHKRDLTKASRFLCSPLDVGKMVARIAKVLKKQAEKYKLAPQVLKLIEALQQTGGLDRTLNIVCVDKWRDKGQYEECPMRIRVIKQTTSEQQQQTTTIQGQYFLTCSFEQSTPQISAFSQVQENWRIMYSIPRPGEIVGADFFLGSYPEFLSTFLKLT